MNHAALPLGFRIELRKVLHQAKALVGDEQLHALQAALLHLTQETRPTGLVFLGAFAHRQNLPIAALSYADGHKHRDVLHFAAPAPLQPQAIKEHIRKLAHQRPFAPLVDLAVDLLVQVAHRAGADSSA